MSNNRNEPTPDGFGGRLRDAIERAGFTQRTLAHKLHLSEAAISKWVNHTNEPDLATLSRISSLLGVSLDWLVGVKTAERPMTQRPGPDLIKAIMKLIRALDAAGEAAAAVAEEMPDDDEA
jgi:transcriptional regulator with XRE-family HTH domain